MNHGGYPCHWGLCSKGIDPVYLNLIGAKTLGDGYSEDRAGKTAHTKEVGHRPLHVVNEETLQRLQGGEGVVAKVKNNLTGPAAGGPLQDDAADSAGGDDVNDQGAGGIVRKRDGVIRVPTTAKRGDGTSSGRQQRQPRALRCRRGAGTDGECRE